MTTLTITLTLPMPPNMANARVHWRAKDRERREYLRLCDVMLVVGQLPKPPDAPLPRATIAAAMILGAHMDDDNALARLKWPVDWLRTRGYIADDRRSCLTWAGLPSQTVTRKTPPAVTLTLTAA